MTDVSYVPGDRTAVVGERCWVLIDAAPDSAAVQEIWQRMEQSSSLDALLSSLLGAGLGHIPGFALLAADDGRHHVICRGRGSATLIADGSPERVDGTELATWREHPVAANAERVILGDPPSGADLQLPASAGVFLAHSITVALRPAPGRPASGAFPAPPRPAVRETGNEAGGTPDPLPMDPPAGPRPAARADDARTTVSRPAAAGWVAADAVLPGPGGTGHEHADAIPAGPGGPGRLGGTGHEHADAIPTGPGGPGGVGQERAGAGPPEDTGYDFLFAATQARTVEDAAVRPADGSEADDGLLSPLPVAAPEEPPFRPPPPPPEPAAPAGLDDLVAPGGLIDSVPWAAGPVDVRPARPANGLAPPHPSTPPGPAGDADGDSGLTVKRSDLPKLASRPVLQDRIGPTVHAVLCPSAHANPPSSPSCRQCAAPLPEQDPVTVPRPVLGVLRLSTGDVVTLDRGVIMGRNPRTDFDGDERPHIVKLPSGDGDISRTHLQISLDGWHVLVTDLKSTNGTLVALPGRDPEQLRPDEPLLIQPGTLVTLADGIDFRYEVAQ